MTSAEDRYRALLDASSALADQPTVKAVLHSLRAVFSGTSRLHGAEIYLFSDDENSLYTFEFDRDADAPSINFGAKLLREGAVATVLQEQRPVFVPDLSQEMLKHPEMAPFAPETFGRSTYLFPLSTSHKRYGILSTPLKLKGQEFAPEDVEMLGSFATHVAVALESALARDTAERERDQLSLLLEINNHIVSKLDLDELAHAVAGSMHKHFGTDAITFWVLNQESGFLERRFIEFPTGRGFLEKVDAVVPNELLSEWWRLRIPQFYGSQEMPGLPTAIREAVMAESLISHASVPLVNAKGPLGLMNMSSRKSDAFSEADRDVLFQVGTQISLVLDNALAYGRMRASRDDLEDKRLYLESEISSEYNFEDIVGSSPAIRQVFEQISIVARTDSTVLLHGETGTGKELIARAIHNLSSRRERTFVRMNCAAIPSGLLESELFGHEKGAFTGALIQKKGRFELADRGSLFLDEIGDISLELQPKLLRAVQEQEFERLGSSKTIHVDVRLIAATHQDLPVMIRDGKFREDLFYRLNVFPVEIPPLRQRQGDVPLLVNYFVSKMSRRMGKRITSIPKPGMEALANALWPGNVRELQNFIERAVILSQGTTLNVPVGELKWRSGAAPVAASVQTLAASEREAILRALREANGVIANAAVKLGMKRTTLNSKMRKLQIGRSDLFAN